METLSGIGVIDKAMAVLRLLEESGPLHPVDVQTRAGLPRSTAHRLIWALEQHGLVRRLDSGAFALGWALVGLGRAAALSSPLLEAAPDILEDLRRRTGESVQLYVREGDQRRCVLSLESPHGLRWIVPEGALLPLDLGSAGRILSGADVARTGWLASVGEREAGVASVSVPVHGPTGVVVAAVSVSGPIERLSRKPGDRHGASVVKAARALERAIRITT